MMNINFVIFFLCLCKGIKHKCILLKALHIMYLISIFEKQPSALGKICIQLAAQDLNPLVPFDD